MDRTDSRTATSRDPVGSPSTGEPTSVALARVPDERGAGDVYRDHALHE
jgi:hypothetical protein